MDEKKRKKKHFLPPDVKQELAIWMAHVPAEGEFWWIWTQEQAAKFASKKFGIEIHRGHLIGPFLALGYKSWSEFKAFKRNQIEDRALPLEVAAGVQVQGLPLKREFVCESIPLSPAEKENGLLEHRVGVLELQLDELRKNVGLLALKVL